MRGSVAAGDDLVATGDVARISGCDPNTVSQWVRRYPDFRALAVSTSAGLIWRRSEVLGWLKETGRIPESA
jgi:transposase-like protein